MLEADCAVRETRSSNQHIDECHVTSLTCCTRPLHAFDERLSRDIDRLICCSAKMSSSSSSSSQKRASLPLPVIDLGRLLGPNFRRQEGSANKSQADKRAKLTVKQTSQPESMGVYSQEQVAWSLSSSNHAREPLTSADSSRDERTLTEVQVSVHNKNQESTKSTDEQPTIALSDRPKGRKKRGEKGAKPCPPKKRIASVRSMGKSKKIKSVTDVQVATTLAEIAPSSLNRCMPLSTVPYICQG